MKLLALLGKGAVATGVVAAGLGSGQWINQSVHRTAPVPRAESGTVATPDPNVGGSATTDSLFHYNFVPGERLVYELSADVQGTGIESLAGSSGVALGIRSLMEAYTETVDLEGNGYIDIRFTDMVMQGSFMDAPVSLVHSATGTEYQYGREHVNTAAGDSTAGIPQLAFFNEPTKAKISPAGTVLKVSGAPGMEQMLAPEKLVASVEFPSGDLDPGSRWESEFGMPVPGLGSLVPTKAINELVGFDLYRGRYCAQIRQTFGARQEGGTVQSPESALGEEMNFSMPEFNVSGENILYFDVDSGKLIEADLDLNFTMRIGQQLQAVAGLLSVYGDLLNEIEGNRPGEPAAQEDLLKLGLKIDGKLLLRD